MASAPLLRLGTRRSPLAMAQAQEARARLCAAHGLDEAAVELVPVLASGDRIQDRALAEIGGKALWTRELDQWLVLGEAVGIHIATAMIDDGIYQTARARPILRGGGPADYFEITEAARFEMRRPG